MSCVSTLDSAFVPRQPGRVLVTGATGFIGHYVLAALLSRGVACAVLLRPPLSKSTARLAALLRPLGVDLQEQVTRWRLALVEGDVNLALPADTGLRITSILHAAGVTAFEQQPNGDPHRTNVVGTANLLAWAATHRISTFHLVSSAYRCGAASHAVLERLDTQEPTFLNAYERSKWESERLAGDWARQAGRTLTVFRPSIVVGDQTDGRTTGYRGFYMLVRASDILAQWCGEGDSNRRALRLRLDCGGDGVQDLVPVDYVATMIAHAVADSRWHGGVYHLTHPTPTRNATIKAAIDEHFGFAGSSFMDVAPLDEASLGETERVFYESTRQLRRYLAHHPRFDRTNAAALQAASGATCHPLDAPKLRVLIGYAQKANWGRRQRDEAAAVAPVRVAPDDAAVARYFEDYLPHRVARSRVAEMTALTAMMRFVISDVHEGQWVCRFERGRLVCVRRTTEPDHEDFTYTTTREVFWRAVAGELDPQEVFLRDLAMVAGDIEAAIKMVVILHQFNREFPCQPGDLAAETTVLCPAS